MFAEEEFLINPSMKHTLAASLLSSGVAMVGLSSGTKGISWEMGEACSASTTLGTIRTEADATSKAFSAGGLLSEMGGATIRTVIYEGAESSGRVEGSLVDLFFLLGK